jgi:glutaredoxin
MAPKLKLYYFESCPYCRLVINCIEEHNIKVDYMDIWSSEEILNDLINKTGRKTVPVLFIDEKPFPESSEIVKWLENNLDKLDKNA